MMKETYTSSQTTAKHLLAPKARHFTGVNTESIHLLLNRAQILTKYKSNVLKSINYISQEKRCMSICFVQFRFDR